MNKYLSIDIGGSAIKYGIISSDGESGNLEAEGKVSFPDSMAELTASVKSLFERYQDRDLKGIAISMPGVIDSVKGTAVHGGALRYIQNCNIQKLLQEQICIPLTVENDGKCAALGEFWMGALKGVTDGIVMVFGTGIGGGIISNGKLLRGAHMCAGEFSFIQTNNEGDLSLNAFAGQNSATLLIKRYQEEIGDNDVDGIMFFDRVERREDVAYKMFQDYCRKIAFQILNMQHTMDPEKFVIGGGISSRQIVTDMIAESVRTLREEIMNKNKYPIPEPVVLKAKLGNHANLFGALKRFLELQEIS